MTRAPTWLVNLARMIRLQNAMMVLCAALVSAYGASMYASIHRAYRQTMEDAGATLASIARSSEVGTNRAIFEIDAALLGVERMLDTLLPDAPLDDPAVKALLSQFDNQTLVVRDILILDNQGRLLNKAGWSSPAKDYSQRAFFTVHRTGSPSLFIGRPRRDEGGGWSVVMSRPLWRHNEVVGVVAAEVPISVFTDFYNSVAASSGVGVKLLFDDGALLAAEPLDEERIGRDLPEAPVVLDAVHADSTGLLGIAPESTEPNVVSFTRVAGRPLIITASRRRADILSQWRGECANSLIAFVIFTVTAGCLTWLMVRAVERQQKVAAELGASEERLLRQSDLLQSTLESMGEGLSVFAADGRLVAWNEKFVELLDLPFDLTAADSNLRDILAFQVERGDFGSIDVSADLDSRFERFYREVPLLRERVTASGRMLQIRRRAMPGGGVVSLYSDVTEQKAADTKMSQAWAQAELANRAKSDFLANMSHELRTPLNAIIGFSEILAGEHLGPLKNLRYLEYAHDIHTSGEHLLSIINDVLDMSKIEAGRLEIHEEDIPIRTLLGGSLRMVRERARQQSVELVSRVADPDHMIFADERAMKQCLLNLLSNAIKFSHPGGTIAIEATVSRDGGSVLSIADDGIGMTEEELRRALQPFGQAQASTTRTHGGTGLGLPITQGLVEAHGGVMTVASAPGEGTRVTITLPPDRTRSAASGQFALRA
jgi:signal transduction histidine kinase